MRRGMITVAIIPATIMQALLTHGAAQAHAQLTATDALGNPG